MNFRTTAILLGGVVVLALVLLIAALSSGDAEAGTDRVLAELAGTKAEDVETVELSRTQPSDQTISFRKESGRWEMVKPAPGHADGVQLDRLVRELLAAKPAPYKDALDNLTLLGLKQPTFVVKLKAGEKAAGINVGTTTIGGDQAVTFVASQASPERAFAVRTADLRSLFKDSARSRSGDAHTLAKWTTDYRPKRLLANDIAKPENHLDRVKLSRGSKVVDLERTGDDWFFTAPSGYGQVDVAGDSAPSPERFTGLRPLLNVLIGFQTNGAEDYIEDVPADKLGTCGLDPADAATVRIELTAKGQRPEVLFLGKKEEKDGKPVVPTRIYARLDGDTAIAKITTDRLDALINALNDPKPLRNRDLLPESAKDSAVAIDSTLGSGFSLRKVSKDGVSTWVLYGQGSPVRANQVAVQDLLARISTPRFATETLIEPNDAAFAKPVGEWKIWTTGLDAKPADKGQFPSEAKPTGEPATFLFGASEGESTFVRRTQSGKSVDFKVPLTLLADLGKLRTQLIDPQIAGYPAAQAKSFVLNRNNTRFEVEKLLATDPAYRGGAWKFLGPESQKGKIADGDVAMQVLDRAALLATSTIHAEGPSDDELKSLGLDPAGPVASLKVSVPTFTDEKEREYHIGRNTPDDKNYYFRVVGKPYVFLAPKTLVSELVDADLTDKVLFRTDKSKIKALYLTGWKPKGPMAKPLSAILELQNGVWVAKEPAAAAVDPNQVLLILAAFESPKAYKAIGPEDPILKTNLGFDDTSHSFIAELDDKSSVSMLIGAEVPDKSGFYARVAGGTFIIAAGSLRSALEKSPLLAK